MRQVVTSLVAALFIATGMPVLSAADDRLCGRLAPDTVTIITAERLAGLTTFDGYRMTGEGRLTRARWTGQNELIAMSDPVARGRDAFAKARRVARSVDPSEREAPEDGTTLSPPVRTIELATSDGRTPTHFVFRDSGARALDDLIAEWQEAAPLGEPARGDFIWSVAVPHDPGEPDVTLRSRGCEDAGAELVAASLASSRIVTRHSSILSDDLKIDRTGRQRFIADLPEGFAYFGVVSAR